MLIPVSDVWPVCLIVRPHPHVTKYFWMRNFFFSGSILTNPANSAVNPETFESALQRTGKKLNPQRIRERVDGARSGYCFEFDDGKFLIRKEKVADSKISGNEWTGPKLILWREARLKWTIPLWPLICSIFTRLSHLSKRNGFPGWRHRPTRPILLVTRPWTTVARIFRILKIHRKSRKNRTTIIFSPMWSEQKGLFCRLRKILGVRGTLSQITWFSALVSGINSCTMRRKAHSPMVWAEVILNELKLNDAICYV